LPFAGVVVIDAAVVAAVPLVVVLAACAAVAIVAIAVAARSCFSMVVSCSKIVVPPMRTVSVWAS
jgi:hypothetical protein